MKLLPILALFALWQGVVWLFAPPHFILPGPGRVLGVLWAERGLLASHALVTLGEVMAGLAIGGLLGAVSAIGLALSPRLCRFAQPVLIASQAVPVFALAPIFTLWFGYGTASKVAMAVLIIYFPVTSAYFDALMGVPAEWLAQARVMGARPGAVLWRLRVPAALPGLLTGLRIAAVYAPIGAVIGEWVGASRGLGYLMLLANGRAKIDLMFATVLVIAGLTLALHWIVNRATQAVLSRRAA
ncbi:ABC transporter permease [Paenirhodobacter sp.]|uniref:ABC transporter permease n=1 Tax=Paenirhodobacter sp. TaxID=1965326 RepID=UPI003B400666